MTELSPVIPQGSEAVFPRTEFDNRIAAARRALAQRGLDLLIVSGPESIFYLTGQQTPGYYTFQALMLPVDGAPVFIVRQLEVHNLIANTWLEELEIYQDNADPATFVVEVVQRRGWRGQRIAIDKRGWFLPINTYEALQEQLGAIADGSGVIEQLRVVKSSTEIDKITRAAVYVDAGMRAGMEAIAEGATENDLVAAMMGAAIAAGSEYVGMEPLVSSGPRSGIPHGTWRRRTLRHGDPVFLEMAGCHERYHATLMRSAWLGRANDEASSMMDVCLAALAAALDAIKPGVTCEAVHNACQAVIDAAGYTDHFRKRTGYSIGISFAPDWGEGNVLSLYTGVLTELQAGMVFHIPPALRIYGQFTVGVSETVVVTDNGHRTLSGVRRELVEVRA